LLANHSAGPSDPATLPHHVGEFMTAAGWYPDPSTGQQRYFDGAHWGPPAPPPPSAPTVGGRFTIHYGFALLAVFSLLGTVIPSIFWFASAANVDTTGSTQAEIDGAQAAGGMMSFFGVGWLFWGGMWTIIWTAFAIQHTLRSRRR
jgi:hypothetical protein